MENMKGMSVDELIKEARIEYPDITEEELKGYGLRYVGGSSGGGVDFMTDSGGEIDIYMGIGKEHGTVRMSNPDDKREFNSDFLRDTAMRILVNGLSSGFIGIYAYKKYMDSKNSNKERI